MNSSCPFPEQVNSATLKSIKSAIWPGDYLKGNARLSCIVQSIINTFGIAIFLLIFRIMYEMKYRNPPNAYNNWPYHLENEFPNKWEIILHHNDYIHQILEKYFSIFAFVQRNCLVTSLGKIHWKKKRLHQFLSKL